MACTNKCETVSTRSRRTESLAVYKQKMTRQKHCWILSTVQMMLRKKPTFVDKQIHPPRNTQDLGFLERMEEVLMPHYKLHLQDCKLRALREEKLGHGGGK